MYTNTLHTLQVATGSQKHAQHSIASNTVIRKQLNNSVQSIDRAVIDNVCYKTAPEILILETDIRGLTGSKTGGRQGLPKMVAHQPWHNALPTYSDHSPPHTIFNPRAIFPQFPPISPRFPLLPPPPICPYFPPLCSSIQYPTPQDTSQKNFGPFLSSFPHFP